MVVIFFSIKLDLKCEYISLHIEQLILSSTVFLVYESEISTRFFQAMEQSSLKIVNNCLNTNIYSYLETSAGQSYDLYLNVVDFFSTSVNWTSVA